MEHRLYRIEEIAKKRGWMIKEAVRRQAVSGPLQCTYVIIDVVRVRTNGERIENILREAGVFFYVLPVINTEFRLLNTELLHKGRPYPYMMVRNDLFGGPGTLFLLSGLPLDFDFAGLVEDVHWQLDHGAEPSRAKTAAELLMDKVDARARRLCRDLHENEEDPCALIFSDDMEEKYPDTYYLEAVTALREYGYSPEDVLKMPGVESNPLVVEFAEKLRAWQKGR